MRGKSMQHPTGDTDAQFGVVTVISGLRRTVGLKFGLLPIQKHYTYWETVRSLPMQIPETITPGTTRARGIELTGTTKPTPNTSRRGRGQDRFW